MDISVQLFSFDEPADRLAGTMDAYAECDVPPFVDSITYEACVTPKSTVASHPEAARAHPVFDLVETPAGKLSSRNKAHERAVRSGSDVVVSGDADAPPLTTECLSRLLRPLRSNRVVAANSNPIATSGTGPIVNVIAAAEDAARPHMHGQCSAFSVGGWKHAGPFDTEIDQTDIRQVRREEEFRFYRRLSEVGNVVKVHDAKVLNDTRRVTCAIESAGPGRSKYPFCRRAGEHTFHPSDKR